MMYYNILLLVLLSFGSTPVLSTSEILKGKYDSKEYKHIILDNEVQALLVSKPYAKESIVVAHMDVGSADEPDDLPGLAHLLEHMLFRGTSEFPNKNEFGEYVSSHNGINNAATTTHYTQFYVRIPSSYFEGALHRLSRYFTAPLLSAESVENEIDIVDSEYNGKKDSVAFHLKRIGQLLSQENHPYSKFIDGNRKTLKIDPEKNHINVHERLVEFYENKYSSHKLKLVIYGNQNITQLENYVINYFSDILKKEDMNPYRKDEPPYDFKTGPKSVVVESNSIRKEILWQIPHPEYYADSLRFLVAILDDWTPGGFQREIFVSESTSILPHYEFLFNHYILKIRTSGNTSVFSMILAYLRYLRTVDLIKIVELYDSKKKLPEFHFEVGDFGDSLSWLQEIAKRWSEGLVPLSEILRASANVPDPFNEESFHSLIDQLLGSEFFLIHTVDFTLTDEQRIVDNASGLTLKILYRMPETFLKPLDNPPKFSLPGINRFIPEKFTMKQEIVENKYCSKWLARAVYISKLFVSSMISHLILGKYLKRAQSGYEGIKTLFAPKKYLKFTKSRAKSFLSIDLLLDKSIDLSSVTIQVPLFQKEILLDDELGKSGIDFQLVMDESKSKLTFTFYGFDDKLMVAVYFVLERFLTFKFMLDAADMKCKKPSIFQTGASEQAESYLSEIYRILRIKKNQICKEVDLLVQLLWGNIRDVNIRCFGNFYISEVEEFSQKIRAMFPTMGSKAKVARFLNPKFRPTTTVKWTSSEILCVCPERIRSEENGIVFFLDLDCSDSRIIELASKVVTKFEEKFLSIRNTIGCYIAEMSMLKREYRCGIRFRLQSKESTVAMERRIEEFIADLLPSEPRGSKRRRITSVVYRSLGVTEETEAIQQFVEQYMMRGGQKRKKLSIHVLSENSAEVTPRDIPGAAVVYSADEVVEMLNGPRHFDYREYIPFIG